ncbi:MAG: tetratricopeptide repeat protein [Chlorobi bacterium]|nr:tetratricopeptide repeat protein [Chlorobiota bacterium]
MIGKLSILFLIGQLVITTAIAKPSIEQIIEAFKKSYEAEKEGNYSQAIKYLQEVYDENSYPINLRLGWLSYMLGQFQQSIAYYNKAISLMPYSIEAKFGIIYPLYALGRIDEVIKQYKEILKIDPNNYRALYYLGSIYFNQGKYLEAYDLFKKLVNLYPFDYDAVIMLAWTSYYLKKYKEAKALFETALMNNPYSESAKQGLELLKQ